MAKPTDELERTKAPEGGDSGEPESAVFQVKALKLYESINLKGLKGIYPEDKILPAPQGFVLTFPKGGLLFLFRFGCVAFYNLSEEVVEQELDRLRGALGPGVVDPPVETYEIRRGESVLVEFEHVTLKRLTRDHATLICLSLAQSVALDYLERHTEKVLDTSTAFFQDLSHQGKLPVGLKALVKVIGSTVTTRQDIVSRLAILDAPDETWKSKELDTLYRDMRDNFEIDLRFRAVDRKLTLLQDNTEVLADLSNYQRANVLEFLILLLILIEIVLGITGLVRH